MAKSAVATKVQSTSVATASDTDFMKKYGLAGTENIDSSSVETPRIVLMQALSPQVEKYGAKQGTYFHSILEQDLGDELTVVPIYIEKTATLWRPRADGGGVLARQEGPIWVPSHTKFEVTQRDRTVVWDTKGSILESGLLNWGSSVPDDPRSLPAATETYNFVFALPDHPDGSPVVLSCSKTAIKPVKKMLSQIKISGKPSFGLKFILSSDKVENNKGKFFIPKFTMNGLTTEKECDGYYETYKLFASKEQKIGVSDADHDGDVAVTEGRF
jgi:hypothetical protein